MGLAELGHQPKLGFIILVAEEGLLPAVPSLGDVVRQSRCDDAEQVEPSTKPTHVARPDQFLSMVSPELFADCCAYWKEAAG